MSDRRRDKIVYKVVNKINKKIYIGWCIDFKERKARHLNEVKKGTKSHFYNAIRKYGKHNFIWSIEFSNLKSHAECKKIEIELIKKYNSYYNGYNSTLGGDGGNTYSKLSKEQKAIMRHKCSVNNARYWKGKQMPFCNIIKMKNADRSKQYKSVIKLDTNGVFIQEYLSIKHAAIANDCSFTQISKSCNSYKIIGNTYTTNRRVKNNIWVFKENYNLKLTYSFKKIAKKSKCIYIFNLSNVLIGSYASAKIMSAELNIPVYKVYRIINSEIIYNNFKFKYEK